MKKATEQTIELVTRIAKLTKDGECANCGGDCNIGEELECTCDPEDSAPFDMSADDAFDTLHSLISEARQIIAGVSIIATSEGAK